MVICVFSIALLRDDYTCIWRRHPSSGCGGTKRTITPNMWGSVVARR